MKREILRLENVVTYSQSSGALNGFRLCVNESEVVGILTLSEYDRNAIFNLLSGQAELGNAEIWFEERRIPTASAFDSHLLHCVDRDASLIPTLSVAENIVMTGPPIPPARLVQTSENQRHAEALLDSVGLSGTSAQSCLALPVFHRTLIRLCRALWSNSRIIVIDDVIAEFTEQEKRSFREIVGRFRSSGISFILIGHDSAELMPFADRLVIVHDGRAVMNADNSGDGPDMGAVMTALLGGVPRSRIASNEAERQEVMRWENVSSGQIKNLRLVLRSGEIVALLDTDRTVSDDFVAILQGERQFTGRVLVENREAQFRHSGALRRLSVCLVPEDPRTLTVDGLSPLENITLPIRDRASLFGGIINSRVMRYYSKELGNELGLDKSGVRRPLSALDESVRFKVAFKAVLYSRPKIAIFLNPGALLPESSRRELMETIAGLIEVGCGVLLLSSDVNAVTRLAHRVLTAAKGSISTGR